MRRIQFSTRTILILMALVSIPCCWVGIKIQQHNKVLAANREECKEIFHRCESIPELQQFIDLYSPKQALEFFENNTKVVSVVCAVSVDDRYDVTFNAPVVINDSGFYDLTGDLVFEIVDSKGEFKKISKNGSASTSPGIRMNATEWIRFVEDGADIESL
ncbi:hypothetical protein N9Y42_11300 [Mariniblastus sp.]|nr:hypothetical protein [Mariniblastus sp.]